MTTSRLLPLTGLSLAIAVAAGGPARAQADQAPRSQATSAPMEVTSDTPEYCNTLGERLRGMIRYATRPPTREVADLSAEGQRMCAHGMTKGGIMRIRKALSLLMQDGEVQR